MSMRVLILFVVVAGAAVLGLLLLRDRASTDPLWASYKQRFITEDGRVIDTGNKNVSHTEGQGYAMLFAVAFNDRATFERVWSWTRQTLRRPDGLFSWRYTPGAENPIADANNASDGDIAICWALLRAAKAWNMPEARDAALDLAAAMRALIVQEGDKAYLLPGLEGFTGDGKRVVNLSYWMFPALEEIGAATGHPVWRDVIATGLALIDQAQFGNHKLPPDWLETSGALRPADGYPPRFGYDAIRVPLYLTWGKQGTPQRLAPFAAYWSDARVMAAQPAWVDLTSNELAKDRMSPGMAAVMRLIVAGGKPASENKSADSGDYYSTSLMLLTRLAVNAYGAP